jgi:hypothetical protein
MGHVDTEEEAAKQAKLIVERFRQDHPDTEK